MAQQHVYFRALVPFVDAAQGCLAAERGMKDALGAGSRLKLPVLLKKALMAEDSILQTPQRLVFAASGRQCNASRRLRMIIPAVYGSNCIRRLRLSALVTLHASCLFLGGLTHGRCADVPRS